MSFPVTLAAEKCALSKLAALCFDVFMMANRPMATSSKGIPQSSGRARDDLLRDSVGDPVVAGLSLGVTTAADPSWLASRRDLSALKPCQFWYPRYTAMASRVAICGNRENCPFSNRLMVDRLMSTPVLDSILSHKNCKSLCTRFSASPKPAALHSSAIQTLTNSRSEIGFACTLKGFERLLKLKLSLY